MKVNENKKINKNLKLINLEEEKDINNGDILSKNEKSNKEFFTNQNKEKNKEELKKYFQWKYSIKKKEDNYEIPSKFFKEFSMSPL